MHSLSIATFTPVSRMTCFEAIGPIVDVRLDNTMIHLSIAMMVQHWTHWSVDRNLAKETAISDK